MKYASRMSVALALCAALPLGARAETPKAAAAITVPFEILRSKHIAVNVMINGKGPYRLIFDTGAPFILINTKTARDSGVIGKNDPKPVISLFNTMGTATIKTFEIGGAKLEGARGAVMDHPTVEAISKVLGPIEGLVGFPFFARYKMTIDYKAKQMILTPNGYPVKDADSGPEAIARAMFERREPGPVMLAPAAQWGFVPHKETADEEPGIVVKEVYPGTAAAAAGLKTGDRLLTLDGRWTDSVADVFQAARTVKAGTAVKLVVKRDAKDVSLTVTPRAGL